MNNVLEKFLNYISIDTTSDSSKMDTPSTKGQIKLAKVLIKELQDLNIDSIYFDDKNCYVYALLKGDSNLPKIGFISHLDTSSDCNGKNINPNVIKNYDGNDIILNNDKVLSTNTYPDLKKHVGKTLITTDGTSLLGADDKAGIVEIISMLQYFSNSNVERGDIFVCFTPDEEIGLGTMHIDKNYFNPDFAYTVDGSTLGEFSYENFNAASATITIKGISSHTGYAKDIMVNAGRIAAIINSLLPLEIPENTSDYQGFYHLEEINGTTENAIMKYLIRDFDIKNFENRKRILTQIVERLNKKYNNCINLEINDTYFNMYEVIKNKKDLIDNTINAIKKVGVNPIIVPVRGGTDGAEISYNGILCPNIGTGGHNFHSNYEYICLEDIEKTTEILISIVKKFANKHVKKLTK